MSTAAGEVGIATNRVPLKLAVLFAFLLGVDQLSKHLVRSWMEPLETVDLFLFVKIQYVRNRGIAFGLLDGHASVIILTSVVIVILMVVAALVIRNENDIIWPMAMLLAGSGGNLLDRLWQGSVTDFIRIPHWPAFNLADIFIVIGVAMLIRTLWIRGMADGGV